MKHLLPLQERLKAIQPLRTVPLNRTVRSLNCANQRDQEGIGKDWKGGEGKEPHTRRRLRFPLNPSTRW